MAIEVKRGLEQQEFLLANDKDFHTQIHSIKRTSNGGKYFSFDADRNEKGHADSFWAWALANMAVGNENTMNFYEKRAAKKQKIENIVENTTEQKTEETQNGDNPIIIPKGKSLRQVNKMLGL